jgi:hypothetical protein
VDLVTRRDSVGFSDPRSRVRLNGGYARDERKDLMASSKRQTTMAKMARERKVQERREKKMEKKQAARDAKAAGEMPAVEEPAEEPEGEARNAE